MSSCTLILFFRKKCSLSQYSQWDATVTSTCKKRAQLFYRVRQNANYLWWISLSYWPEGSMRHCLLVHGISVLGEMCCTKTAWVEILRDPNPAFTQWAFYVDQLPEVNDAERQLATWATGRLSDESCNKSCLWLNFPRVIARQQPISISGFQICPKQYDTMSWIIVPPSYSAAQLSDDCTIQPDLYNV